MNKKGRICFCDNCMEEREYRLVKKIIKETIRGKEYRFRITSAICETCGEEVSINELIDLNEREIDSQYRHQEGIVSVEDIRKLMDLYHLGKAPLSIVLGFGEITITRYLEGQVPSKEYSDVIRKALTSPIYMKDLLECAKDKISGAAYRKAMESVQKLEELFTVSERMQSVISVLFRYLEEVTPLMLQKLLYYIQGLSFALNRKEMFSEDCEAWVHGPVYRKVYDLFKEFQYNPIEDPRFSVFDGAEKVLRDEDVRVIHLVADTFGSLNGKMLEYITHHEDPWCSAREGIDADIPSDELIQKESISRYFTDLQKKYQLSDEAGINRYIKNQLKDYSAYIWKGGAGA